MDLLNSENLDTNVAGILSNMSGGRKKYINTDAKFQPFVMYRNADGEVVLSSEPVLAPARNTSTSGDQLTTPILSTAPTSGDQLTTPILSTAPTPSPLEGIKLFTKYGSKSLVLSIILHSDELGLVSPVTFCTNI
jgi:hypothetical protein